MKTIADIIYPSALYSVLTTPKHSFLPKIIADIRQRTNGDTLLTYGKTANRKHVLAVAELFGGRRRAAGQHNWPTYIFFVAPRDDVRGTDLRSDLNALPVYKLIEILEALEIIG
ncbi:hypothetical protein HK097_008700 [Rhizophlyctis rosea]|uniref:Uncharacterized protein n=1 Tax=Rhizophlyctis rosea TaxID=64517 RepID=A0AAD5SI15_9FUNG|nr:hypothetical protein HK097_008700 [Rhizophlyctis rosea]